MVRRLRRRPQPEQSAAGSPMRQPTPPAGLAPQPPRRRRSRRRSSPPPAYGQQMWPTPAVPQRPVDSPQGPYVPGPIFSENSPFRDGPPDGGEPPGRSPFNVTAEEAMTGRLMFGVGVNSDAGLVGSVVLDEQNFDWTRFPTSWEDIRNGTAWRGAGQRFRMRGRARHRKLQRYMVSFQEPYLFDTPVSLGLSGYYYNRIYTEYTEQRLGGRVGLGYQFTPDLSGSIAYRGDEDQHHQSDRSAAAGLGRGDRPRPGPARVPGVADARQARQRLPGHRRAT